MSAYVTSKFCPTGLATPFCSKYPPPAGSQKRRMAGTSPSSSVNLTKDPAVTGVTVEASCMPFDSTGAWLGAREVMVKDAALDQP